MLYVHIPYCHHKCTYCGFYSVAGDRDMQAYVDALCVEIRQRRTVKPLETIYFGGGTPTRLPLRMLEQIVLTIRDNYDLSKLEEATIEANPENLVPEYLEDLARLRFFNRLSIGVQSFDDARLRALNRVHTGRQSCEAVGNAAKAGFDNVSVDLIMGQPSQSVDDWRKDLQALGGLLPLGNIKHLSCYELTVETGSILERQLQMGRKCMPDEETVAGQYEVLMEWCAENGFEPYEVSNYCIRGWHSRHNSRYWNRTPYIGVGAAAHSFDGIRRRWNPADIECYIAGAGEGRIPFEEEVLSADDAYNEYLMTALRTVEGIEKARVAEEYRDALAKTIRPFVEMGLVTETATHYRPTSSGMLRADGIAARLFL